MAPTRNNASKTTSKKTASKKTASKKTASKKTASKKTTNMRVNKKIAKAPLPPVDLNKLFPPWGSEDAKNQTANKEATDITVAIYHDINAYCELERLAGENVYGCLETFSNLRTFTEGFMEREITGYMSCMQSFEAEHGEFQSVTPNSRFLEFVTALGWKMFAICSHTESFRRGIKEADDRAWGCLLQKIHENLLSIELYAHNRTLKWRDILWVYQNYPIPGLPDMKSEIETYMNWKVDHPHHTVITLDGKLKEPIYNGQLQKHINESIYDPKKWSGQKQDPTLRHKANGTPTNVGRQCVRCGSPVSCACRLETRAGELIELREYSGTGTGVRALTRFRRGDILDIFMGELLPDIVENVYPLTQNDDKSNTTTATVNSLCTICPHQFGNWTRFISHSCRPATQFMTRTIGNRVVCTVEVVHDILPFEEITVGYGDRYWTALDYDCLCGHCDGSGSE